MKNSGINWTDHTANFWWGCMKVSEGCQHCYAETLSKRYGKKIWGPPATTEREEKKGIWKDILKWDAEAKAEGIRRRVFVSSMSDFLEDHPQVYEIRNRAMDVIEKLEWLDILMLTKRPENAPKFLSRWYDNFPAHVWMGTTTENQEQLDKRLPRLLEIPSAIHFLSVEPQIEHVTITTFNAVWHSSKPLSWVIVGGESGAGCRPFDWDWARSLRNQCSRADIAFWMKQGGGHPNKRHELSDIPEDLRIRNLPL